MNNQTPVPGNSAPPQPERREFVRVALMLGLGATAIGAGVYNLAVRLPAPVRGAPLPLLPLEDALKRGIGAWVGVEVTVARRDAYKLVSHGQSVFLRREKEGEAADCFTALSPVCPHAGCNVELMRGKEAPDSFRCACHNARFAADGAVEGGPSPRAMDSLALSIGEHDGRKWLMVDWKDFLPGTAEKIER